MSLVNPVTPTHLGDSSTSKNLVNPCVSSYEVGCDEMELGFESLSTSS